MKFFNINREVGLLTLGFILIFFGYNGIQQYITTFFAEAGLIDVGFRSLILIYVFFCLASLLSGILVSRYGAKRFLIASPIFYSGLLFSLLTKNTVLIYLFSILSGFAAAFLWTAQNSYFLRVTDEKSYGANAGFFNSGLAFGSALGLLILGFLISIYSFSLPFFIFAFFPLIGLSIFFGLKDVRIEPKKNQLQLLKKTITSRTALSLSSIWFSFSFSYGLVIGAIPLAIKSILGISYIGVLSSLFYIMPILFAYIFGRISDSKGRKTMIIYSYVISVLALILMFFSETAPILVLGIILLALNDSIIRPMTLSFLGDVSTRDNLEFLTSLFWMVQNIGIISALLVSALIQTKSIYLIAIAGIAVSLAILLPVFRLGVGQIKEKISREVNMV